jgi:hypothetical protein
MRGRVCRLQLMLVLASAVILVSESCGAHDHVLLSQTRDSPNLEGQAPVFTFPRSRMTQLYPQALDSFSVASYDPQSYGGGIRTRLHSGSESESLCDWRFTANQVRLGAKPLEAHDQSFFCLQLNPCGHSRCVICSPTRRWAFSSVRIAHVACY